MLSPASWFETKAAALLVAEPPLARDSAETPAIDAQLSRLAGARCWAGETTDTAWRAAKAGQDTPEHSVERRRVATETVAVLTPFAAQLAADAPQASAGTSAVQTHEGMAEVAQVLRALAQLQTAAAEGDLAELAPEAA